MIFWAGVFGGNERVINHIVQNQNSFGNCEMYQDNNWCIMYSENKSFPFSAKPVWHNQESKIMMSIDGWFVLNNTTLDASIINHKQVQSSLLERINRISEENILAEFRNGIFNGIIIKPQENEILLFNDLLGLQPLYYTIKNKQLIFSTKITILMQLIKKIKSLEDETNENELIWDNNAITEFLQFGFTIDSTIMPNIKRLPPNSVLKISKDNINIHKIKYFGLNNFHNSNQDRLQMVKEKWESAIGAIATPSNKISLALTGGLDSRLIFAEWPYKKELRTFTGIKKDQPDFILAKQLTDIFDSDNKHILECYDDKSVDEIIESFIVTLKKVDNPLFLPYFKPEITFRWKLNRNMQYILSGIGGEIMGGDYIHQNRKISTLIKEAFFPIQETQIDNSKATFNSRLNLIKTMFHYDKSIISCLKDNYIAENREYQRYIKEKYWSVEGRIGNFQSIESYLERMRLVIKIPYFRFYSQSREYYETCMPFLGKYLLNYLVSIPPSVRGKRRLQFQLLNRYYREMEGVKVTSSFLAQSKPYMFHKIFQPFVKGINTGLRKRIPFFQSKQLNFSSDTSPRESASTSKRFKKLVIAIILGSNLYNKKINSLLLKYSNQKEKKYTKIYSINMRIWKLFCLALAEKRFSYSTQQYHEWIDQMNERTSSGQEKSTEVQSLVIA